jgi:hypothetical protein
MNFTREPPMSIARIVGREARLPAFFLLVFFAMNSRPALPDEHNYSRYAAEVEKQTARSFVLHPTPFCSQRTNRNRPNQREPILNNAFASCFRSKRSPPPLPADLPGAQNKSCRITCGKTARRANHLKPVQPFAQKYFA